MDLEELQARWLERMHAQAGVSYGQTLALALTPCVPTRFETQTFPALLRLETQSPSACALVQQEVQDGTAAVTLLSVLGRVCRVSTPAMTPLASRGAGGPYQIELMESVVPPGLQGPGVVFNLIGPGRARTPFVLAAGGYSRMPEPR